TVRSQYRVPAGEPWREAPRQYVCLARSGSGTLEEDRGNHCPGPPTQTGPSPKREGPAVVRWSETSPGPQHQTVTVHGPVHHHGAAIADVTGQQHPGELVADLALHQPPQRPGTVGGVVSLQGEPFAGSIGHVQLPARVGGAVGDP